MSAVACRVCGAATDKRATRRTEPGRFPGQTVIRVSGVCDDCQTLRPEEPGSAVRAALRLVGKPEEDWPLAAQAFEEAGVDVAFLPYGERDEPQRKPWAHVPKEAKADLRRAYVRVLDHRVHAAASQTTREVPPHAPDPEYPQACLACGVAKSIDWHGPTTTGAYTKPGMVTGVLCDGCVGHFVAAGYAHGPQVLERAVMAHFDKEWSEVVRLPRLQAWVATGLPPQDRPWAWVTELVDPPPVLDPILALRIAVKELTERLDRLEGRS